MTNRKKLQTVTKGNKQYLSRNVNIFGAGSIMDIESSMSNMINKSINDTAIKDIATLSTGTAIADQINKIQGVGNPELLKPTAKKGLSQGAKNAIGAGASIVGGLAGGLIGGGLQSTAGNAISGIGSTAGAIMSAIPGIGTMAGGIVSGASQLLGGVTNKLFGSNLNKENIARVEGDINNTTNTATAMGSAATSDELNNLSFVNDFDQSYIGSDGLFSNKAKNKFRELQAKREQANNYMLHGFTTGAINLDNRIDDIALAHSAAYGGTIDNIDPTTTIGYSMLTDLIEKDNNNNKKNMTNTFRRGGSKQNNNEGNEELSQTLATVLALDTPINRAIKEAQLREEYRYPYNGGEIIETPNMLERTLNNIKGTIYHDKTNPAVVYPTMSAAAALPVFAPEGLAGYFGTAGATLPLETLTNLLRNKNQKAFGGNVETHGGTYSTDLTHIDTGGSHEKNPNEGVQIGVDHQGTPNLVEEGEVIYDDYVFSDRLTVPEISKKKDLTYDEKVLKKYSGKTYADAAKKAEKESGVDERPNDEVSRKTFEAILEVLAQSQEKEREMDKLRQMQEAIKQMTPEEFTMMQQQQAAQEAQQQQQQQAEEDAMMQQQQMQQPQQVQQQEIPQGMEYMQQPIEEQQPIAALGGLLNSENEFKYGGNLEKFTNELRSYGLTLDDYLAYYRSTNNIAEDKNLPLTDDNFNRDTAEQYLKQVTKAQKEVARKYRQEGLNPKDLTGVSLEAYQRDVTAAARGTNVTDDDLAINGFSSNNRGDARATDFNRYAYTRTTRQNLIGGGATELKPNAEGKFDINYGVEDPTGITYIKDMPKWNTSAQQWEDAEGNKVDNPFGEGTKFSNVTGGEYNSAFKNQDELSQYYKDQITKRFQNLKGEKYNAEKLPNYFLSKEELGNWIADLEGSEEAKDKELAKMLRANWNLDADNLIESDAYLGLDAVKKNRLQQDAKPGIEHIPYLNAVPYAGVRYRELDTDGNPTDNYINWDSANPITGFSVIEQPLSTEGGVTTYGIKRNNLSSNVGVLPDGTYISLTPEQATLYANNKIEDSSSLPQYVDPLEGYNHNATYYDLSKDVNGNLLGVKQDKNTDTDKFPTPSNWPYLLAGAAQLGTLGYNIFKKPDYSRAEALIKAAKEVGKPQQIQFRPIGNLLEYRPMDVISEQNRQNAIARSTDRYITNNAMPISSQIAGLIANGYNSQLASGQLFENALKYNDRRSQEVAEYNKDTAKFNSEGFLKADMANQDAANRAKIYSLEGLKSGYTMEQAIADARSNAINAGISGLANLGLSYAQNKWNNDLYKYAIDKGAFAGVHAAKGGKLRKKNKGLNF